MNGSIIFSNGKKMLILIVVAFKKPNPFYEKADFATENINNYIIA